MSPIDCPECEMPVAEVPYGDEGGEYECALCGNEFSIEGYAP